jgi:hypothetical protein
MYDGINFETNNNMMSEVGKDNEIVSSISTNIKTAFSFNKVQ